MQKPGFILNQEQCLQRFKWTIQIYLWFPEQISGLVSIWLVKTSFTEELLNNDSL